MNPFTFSNIGNQPHLSVTLLAEDIAGAIKRFNNIWGGTCRYNVHPGYAMGASYNVLS